MRFDPRSMNDDALAQACLQVANNPTLRTHQENRLIVLEAARRLRERGDEMRQMKLVDL